ncbi:MFS transporter [Hyphococcus formosus]|uniref:spinster family MFS transporter n=1 Tax=Hyphococcus formosus TaxID=3143534 RepID=UPI00398AA27C
MSTEIENPQKNNSGNLSYPKPLIAWFTVAALFVAYIFSFIDRMIIGLLVEPMKADLQISDTEISLLQGMAFAVFYTIAGIPIGRLIDRSSRVKIISIGISLWSLMTMVCGFASHYWQLFLARMGVGVGEATLSPAAYSIITDSFAPNRLGLAMGVYGLGSAIGAGLAFIIGAAVISLVASTGDVVLPIVGEVRSWQAAFLIVGAPGFLVAVIFTILPEPARRSVTGKPVETAPMSDVIKFVKSRFSVLAGIFFAVGFVNLSVFAAVSWLPVLYMRSYGMALADAGYVAGGAMVFAGFVGLLGGGWICDKLGGLPHQRIMVSAVAGIGGIIGGFLFPLMPGPISATILFIVFFIACTTPVGAAVSALQQISPNTMRATLSAAYLFVVNIVGMAFGPTATALIGDVFFPQDGGIRYAMAIVAGLGFVVAVGLFLNTARHLKGWTPDEDIPAEPVKSPAHAPNLGPAVADEGVV